MEIQSANQLNNQAQSQNSQVITNQQTSKNSTSQNQQITSGSQANETTSDSDHSHSRTSSEAQFSSANQFNQYTFGRDLWDCLSTLNESTTQRTFFMKSLRNFFSSYKKALDSFSSHFQKALQQYEKDFVRIRQDQIVDTLSTAMVNVKMCMDEMLKEIHQKSDHIQREMVDPLETYYKHYGHNNNELIKQGNQFWNNLHQERTSMLFAKENYYNSTQQSISVQLQLQELKNQYALQIQQAQQLLNQNSPYVNQNPLSARKNQSLTEEIQTQEKKYMLQQNRADGAKQDYEKALFKLNSTIDNFETQYKPILNRIQEADEYQINYVKAHMDKLAKSIESLGFKFKERGEDILQAVAQISSDTDLKIFTELHKSSNPFMQKDDFQGYEHRVEVVKEAFQGQFSLSLGNMNKFNSNQSQRRRSSETSDPLDSQRSQSSSFKAQTPRSQRGVQNYEEGKYQSTSEYEQNEYEMLSSDYIQQDKLRTQELMIGLLNGINPISLEEKGQLIQLMQNKMMRSVLTEILNEINSPKSIQNYDCMKIMADILKFVLTLFVHEQAQDFRLLYTIIESSQNVYCYVNKRKQYLSTLLADHDIWQDKNSWKECIQDIISMKMEDSNRRRKNQKSQSNGKDTEKNFFKKGLSSLKGLISNKDKLDKQQELKSNQNLIFNELSRYVQSTINFGLNYEQANDLLINFCEQFQIEQSRIHLLLTELQSNQKKTANMFTEKEQLIWSLQRRGNRMKAFGFNDKTQILGITIRYIDRDEDLRNILLLNKDLHELLKDEILEQALLKSSQHRLKQKRKYLWLKILKIDEKLVKQEYQRYLNKLPTELPKLVSDAIEVDVNRSFNSLKMITAQNLNNILKSYAITNPELDYCQGMNFIAGFLYLLMDCEESLAFGIMKEVIDKFNMGNLFNQELPMLKLNFYQLDRLISIILSDLHTHFKDETINSSYFSSPYFITLFTSVLQMQTTGDNCAVLQRFWDYFIINGWKSVFKVSLVILKENEEALLQMPFEVMLTQIVNLPIRFFIQEFENQEDGRASLEKFDKLMSSMKIPTMLLERLKFEFDQNYKVSIQKAPDNESGSRSSR